MWQRLIRFTWLFVWFLQQPGNAQTDKARSVELFEKQIRPALIDYCYSCHSSEAQDLKGELFLDSKSGLRLGGASGPVIFPEKPNESPLLAAIEYRGGLKMPPDRRLPREVVEAFREWIRLGAHDPRPDPIEEVTSINAIDPAELWSLQPVSVARRFESEPSTGSANSLGSDANRNQRESRATGDWSRGATDEFLLESMQQEGLTPVADARPEPLLRRLYFDLIGLPPPVEVAQQFAREPTELAYVRVVDRLLGSPEFGERWGRHWMDVARYAESAGGSIDLPSRYAWRYRDWIIDAYQDDLPYDQFVAWQIAGDLFPWQDLEQRDRQRIATGFLAVGRKSLDGGNVQLDMIDDQIDAVGKAVLGLSVACARCHDHKFDPIPTKDYYALVGIFKSTETLYGRTEASRPSAADQSRGYLILGDESAATSNSPAARRLERQIDAARQSATQLTSRIESMRSQLPGDFEDRARMIEEKGDELSFADQTFLARFDRFRTALGQITDWQKEVKRLEDLRGPAPPYAVGVREGSIVADSPLHLGGERNRVGPTVDRGFLSCIGDLGVSINKEQSGRLQLAQWLVHPDNPLTARVAVNRVWSHLYGRGLVSTVDNLGANGERPSHPALLDYLTDQFVQSGWSQKKLIRELVLSRAYRLSSEFSAVGFDRDPDMQWRWRMPRRRLEAEPIHDALLQVAGELNLARQVASPLYFASEGELIGVTVGSLLERTHVHRAVYLPIVRNRVPEALRVFDFPEPSNPQATRNTTSVPAQALYLLNHPRIIALAASLAEVSLLAGDDSSSRIEHLYWRSLSRAPTPREQARAAEFLAGDSSSDKNLWTTFCHALLCSGEFQYVE
jgi:hypothetical protein